MIKKTKFIPLKETKFVPLKPTIAYLSRLDACVINPKAGKIRIENN